MEWILIFIVLIIIFILATKLTAPNKTAYDKQATLFTKAERSFLGVLDQAVGNDYRILGKVRVADILRPAKGMSRKDWQIAFNKISAKHFDYVLCDKETLTVLAVIELDDKSHSSKKAIARDSLLNNACQTAGLCLIRFPASATYQVAFIADTITKAIDSNNQIDSAG